MKAFLHKLRHDRRGIALEMAITLLVVTFALSTLVLSTSLLQHSRKVAVEDEIPRNVILEQIGESFCAATAAGKDVNQWSAAYPDYKITVNGLKLTVSLPDSDTALLTVELKHEGGKYTVTQWSYN
ncbi:MAG: hypothetical protein IJW94_01480 [Oscillospiraceae bacterium]|nr:hypothetical protein [Oscillospiraceae bacterium]